jgi:hypothetical protein
MRFRRLTKEELEQLEQDFVQFLASNQITADDWEKMKETDKPKVHELLDLFSDIVLEKVFSKINYLQHRSKDTIRVFQCKEDKLSMIGLKIEDETKDLTNPKDLAILANPKAVKGAVKMYQIEREYLKERPDEVFEMMQRNGCQVAPDGMYQMLESMYQQTK